MVQGVLRRWLKLAFVTAVLGSAVATAQVFTMQSDLDDAKTPSPGSGKKSPEELPASGAKTSTRAWFPHTDTAVGDGSGRLTSAPKLEVSDKVSRRRDPLGPPDDDSSASEPPSTQDDKDGLTPTTSKKNLDLNSSLLEAGTTTNAKVKTDPKAPSPSGSGSGSTPTPKKKKLVAFTKSPSFSQKAPIPNGIQTADEDTKQSDDEDLTKIRTSTTPLTPEPMDATLESQPDVVSPPDSPAASKSAKAGVKKSSSSSGSKGEEKEEEGGEEEEEEEPDDPEDPGASKLASNSTKKGVTISEPPESTKDVVPSGSLTTDAIQEARSALPEPPPASSQQTPSSPPSSSTAVLADTSSADTSGMSNTLVLGLMMAGAIALVVLVAVFVYIKTVNKDEDEDDPVLRPAHHHDLNLGGPMAQSSLTATADYHKNNNMTPSEYNDGDDFFATKVHQPTLARGLDAFPSNHSTALTQSQMSLPPMAQTGQSMASSGYSCYTTQSDFYGEHSAYSAATASAVDAAYPGYHRQGRGGDSDITEHSEEEESDYEGDSIREMGDTMNAWHSAVHNRAGPSNVVDNRMDESHFDGANSRSTAASDYTGKTQFMDSEYTEYRVSTDGGARRSHGSKAGYDTSFAASKSGYSAATDSRYDSRYDAGGKSFASSGFSEY
uniref:Uncharacterized protein n=1 Tax=Peronospora matthiolae TaxID=2874970 RepID=A0AAV1TBR3_9STRA